MCMAYVALYRKFRPETFEEVKGQDAIVTTLKNQMLHDRIGHAYLFCGTRGTGKTSVAKLLAKAVNCENPKDGSPCGECESCKRIAAGAAMNVIEIDAASNNGVDNIRQINDGVQYAPSDGKKLVYIIDEVHMLSTGAFNALLKTLEEPPSYVIFILATTELHKVPVTIKSRCQRYDFRRIPYGVIADRLQEIMEAEKSSATREALEYIARAADGSMRDALSLLDQCVSYHLGEELTLPMALDAIGAVDTDLFLRLLRGIAADDTVGVMEIISEVVWRGTELTRFTEDFAMFLRNVLFLKLSPALAGSMDLTGETIAELQKVGQELSEDTLQRGIRVLRELLQELRFSSLKRITLEMGIIRLMRPEMDQDLEGVLGRLDLLEKRAEKAERREEELKQLAEDLKNRPAVPAAADSSPGEDPDKEIEMTEEELREIYRRELPKANLEDVMRIATGWESIRKKLPYPHSTNLCGKYVEATVGPEGGEPELTVHIAKEGGNMGDAYYRKPENAGNLEELISEAVGFGIKLQIKEETTNKVSGNTPNLSKIHFLHIEHE